MNLHQNMRAVSLWIAVIVLVFPSAVQAQYNTCANRIWTFGYHDGIDFCSGTPQPYNSADTVREGCATLSDENGIIFYTDGNNVYNKHDTVMPNGTNILPPSFHFIGSATQGALIAPTIKNPHQYYVFSLGSLDVSVYKLAYSKIDMTLDGGLGDVMPGEAGIVIDDSLSEKMATIRRDAHSLWLVTHKLMTPVFKCYLLDSNGISSSPVISNTGPAVDSSYGLGVMKASPDGTKLVLQNFDLGFGGTIELYDFNPATGTVSGYKLLDTMATQNYGAEFSPGLFGNFLYVSQLEEGIFDSGTVLYPTIYQYKLGSGNRDSIIHSKTLIGRCREADMKLAPDGKIYFYEDTTGDPYHCRLGRIERPDSAGAACGYTGNCLTLPHHCCSLGLPNVYVAPVTDSCNCPGITIVTDTVTVTGIKPVEQNKQVFVRPNPSAGDFNVNVTGWSNDMVSLIVTDITGRIVSKTEARDGTDAQLHIADAGVYILSAVSSSGRVVTKLVVQ